MRCTVISSTHNLVFPDEFKEKYGNDFWIEDGKPLASKRPVNGLHSQFLSDLKTLLSVQDYYDNRTFFDFVCVNVDNSEVSRIVLPYIGIGMMSLAVAETWKLREGESFTPILESVDKWNKGFEHTVSTTGKIEGFTGPLPDIDNLFKKP